MIHLIIQKKQGKKGKEEKTMIEREKKKTIMEMRRDKKETVVVDCNS